MLIPDVILRSSLRCDEDESEAALADNLTTLLREVQPEGAERDLLAFVGDVFQRSRKVPSVGLIVDHFTALEAGGDGRAAAVVARLALLQTLPPDLIHGPAFRVAMDTFRRDATAQAIGALIMEASTILGPGLQRRQPGADGRWETVTVQGGDAAMDAMQAGVAQVRSFFKTGTVEGSFRAESQKMRQDIEAFRQDPGRSMGVRSGIREIDSWHRGIKRGELALVLGFVSHMKTTLCLNWLYRAAVDYGHNVALVSLETEVAVIRRLLYVMHANHEKFRGAPDYVPVCLDDVTLGRMDEDRLRYFERVMDDFESNPAYGAIDYREPQESAVTIADIGQWAEGLHRKAPLDLLVIDYLGLVDPDKRRSGMEDASNLNMVLRQAKRLANSFANGRGIAVLSPFQSNRGGLQEAEKNNGKYNLRALSMATEAERSSDLVYSVYLDDVLRGSDHLRLGNLKARNAPVIRDTWDMHVEGNSRLIEEKDLSAPNQRPI